MVIEVAEAHSRHRRSLRSLTHGRTLQNADSPGHTGAGLRPIANATRRRCGTCGPERTLARGMAEPVEFAQPTTIARFSKSRGIPVPSGT